MVGQDSTHDRLVMRCSDGTTAILDAAERSWRCEADPVLERFLNSQWRLQSARDSLEALASSLGKAVRGHAVVEFCSS